MVPLGLSFSPGLATQDQIWQLLGLPVTSPALGASSFALVVAFGRYKFRISKENVALTLQATFGGSTPQFRVSFLND